MAGGATVCVVCAARAFAINSRYEPFAGAFEAVADVGVELAFEEADGAPCGFDLPGGPDASLFTESKVGFDVTPLAEPGRLALFVASFCKFGFVIFDGGASPTSSNFRFNGEAGRTLGLCTAWLLCGLAARFV